MSHTKMFILSNVFCQRMIKDLLGFSSWFMLCPIKENIGDDRPKPSECQYWLLLQWGVLYDKLSVLNPGKPFFFLVVQYNNMFADQKHMAIIFLHIAAWHSLTTCFMHFELWQIRVSLVYNSWLFNLCHEHTYSSRLGLTAPDKT